MTNVSKPILFALLLIIACLTAGLFGAAHNQLSYSVGASYFHDLKFPEFGLPPETDGRIGAAIVGWRASWWIGLAMGVPVFGLALVLMPRKRLFAVGIFALAVALIWTLSGAILGLVLGMVAPQYASFLPIPAGITDTDGYLRAALMHEGAYFGAAAGLIAGVWTVWGASKTMRKPKTREKGRPVSPRQEATTDIGTDADASLPKPAIESVTRKDKT